jgi:hypothetical protein
VDFFLPYCPGGEIGRHAGLKILFAAMRVTVQVRSGARKKPSKIVKIFEGFFLWLPEEMQLAILVTGLYNRFLKFLLYRKKKFVVTVVIFAF